MNTFRLSNDAMRFFLLFWLLSFPGVMKAQDIDEILQDGREWHILETTYQDWPKELYYTCIMNGDTIINDKIWKKVYSHLSYTGSLDLYQAHPQWGGFFKILEMGTEFDPELQFCPDTNHPHAIDLVLPSGTKWACCNVGADTPKGYGDYYVWGEIEEKEIYDWNTYIHCDGTEESCHDLGSDVAGTQYDVAQMKWGGSWVTKENRHALKKAYNSVDWNLYKITRNE